jgi:MFS family permease
MDAEADRPLAVAARCRARRLAYWNGAVWAIGNGLTSGTLVIYLAQELGAERIGLGIGLILAARHVVGLLRLGAPVLIGRLVDRKRFCLAAYLASALVLLGLPWVATPGRLPSPGASLAALVGLWCVYHLLQYVGTIALWSWLADLVPLRIRGRFLGRRERWMVAGEAAAMLSSAAFVWGWQYLHPDQPRWVAYLVPAVMGAGFMIAALVPLVLIPRAAGSRVIRFGATFRWLLAPLGDRRFLRLILFGCWLALANGITQSAQYTYPKEVLNVRLFILLALQTAMFCGQWALGPWLGRLADRLGNRPVMIGSLLLVAQGPLFYYLSTPEQRWWFAGAWVVWIAYAGLNVCLPNLMLKLSPGESNTPYIAMYFAVTGLCYAANTIVGGAMYDQYGGHTLTLPGVLTLDYYPCVFLLGWVARGLGVLVLLLVIEPPGRS